MGSFLAAKELKERTWEMGHSPSCIGCLLCLDSKNGGAESRAQRGAEGFALMPKTAA